MKKYDENDVYIHPWIMNTPEVNGLTFVRIEDRHLFVTDDKGVITNTEECNILNLRKLCEQCDIEYNETNCNIIAYHLDKIKYQHDVELKL